ncbi:MAG: uroporphyrinogen decarboxylase, partial [Jatrophihabitans sp.]
MPVRARGSLEGARLRAGRARLPVQVLDQVELRGHENLLRARLVSRGDERLDTVQPRTGVRLSGAGTPDGRIPGVVSPAVPADSLLVRTARGMPGPHPPVWFMRQAGRSLPEYRALRAGTAMLDACRDPEMIAQITLQPVRRHGVDAAILFSDIVVPLVATGVEIDIVAGVGPVVARPVRTEADLDRFRPLEAADVPYVSEAVRAVVGELGATPLIGFAGAPFTLASYLVEGGPSRDHARTKAMMHGAPHLWDALCGRLAVLAGAFLRVQVAAGACAVQLFDSWAGALSRADYVRYVLPHSRAVLAGLDGCGVPRIHFGVGTGEFLDQIRAAGAEVVGVDWRVPLDEAARRIGPGAVV